MTKSKKMIILLHVIVNVITLTAKKETKKGKKVEILSETFGTKKTPFKMSEGAGELSPVSDEDVFPTPNVPSSSMAKTAVTEMDTLTAPQLRLFLCGLSVSPCQCR